MKRALLWIALWLAGSASAWTAADPQPAGPPESAPQVAILGSRNGRSAAAIRLEASLDRGQVTFLGLDTEGGDRSRINLLRSAMALSARTREGRVELKASGSRQGSDSDAVDCQ